jgi:hypothetical protein
LKDIISQPTAFSADNVMATDNAVSALGKICEFQRDSIDSQVRMFFICCSLATHNLTDLASVFGRFLLSAIIHK